MTEKSNYYFDDKDVFDALQSEKGISGQTLINFLKRRGVFFPLVVDRTFLCNYIATWFNDYSTLDELSLGIKAKRTRTRYTNEELHMHWQENALTRAHVSDAWEVVKKEIETENGSLAMVSQDGGNAFEATWIRQEIDLSKTPLRQRVTHCDKIYVSLNPDGKLLVRTPTGGPCAILRDKLKNALEGTTRSSIDRFSIHLPENASTQDRIDFFMEILTGMPELSLETVTGISLSANEPDSEKNDLDMAEDEQNEIEFNKLLSAKLRGGKLFDTPEYQYLLARNFAPTEIRWWAKNGANELFSLSIGFLNPREGTDFCCNVHGVRRKAESTGILKKTVESLSRDEHIRFMALLENKAREVSRKLLEKTASFDAPSSCGIP